MSRSEIDHCHEALQTKEVELSSTLSRRREISIEKVADALDDIQYTRERELAISNLDRVSKLLRCVRAALARIENGSYGISPRCDSAINPRRLRAVPWAEYCVRCQEAADRHDFDDEIVGPMLAPTR